MNQVVAWSFEDAAEVPPDYWLRFDGAIFVTGVALIALCVVFLLITGVLRAFL